MIKKILSGEVLKRSTNCITKMQKEENLIEIALLKELDKDLKRA